MWIKLVYSKNGRKQNMDIQAKLRFLGHSRASSVMTCGERLRKENSKSNVIQMKYIYIEKNLAIQHSNDIHMYYILEGNMTDKAFRFNAYTIAAMSNKGGPGKTSSTTNVGVSLAQLGKRTLVVDADQQANATEVLANGKKYYAQYGLTICDLYNNQKLDVRDVIIPARHGGNDIPNLFLIPSDPSFERVLENSMSRPHREKILFRHLKSVMDEFDFILIDCSPAFNLSSQNAAYMADHVIIPVDGGSFSLTGAKTVLDFLDEIKEDEFKNYSLFRNEYNSSKTIMNDFIKSELDKSDRFRNHFMKTRIRADETVAQSQVMFVPLYFYKRSALVLNDYRSMAKELIALKEGAK